MRKTGRVILLFIGLIGGFCSCNIKKTENIKVVFVNSYHRGYPPSDEMMGGFFGAIDTSLYGVTLLFMDTKRNPDDMYGMMKGLEIKDVIDSIQPDFLVTSDDAAIKYLVEPYYKNPSFPVLFCGVNWSSDQYNLTKNKVTGILETLPIRETLSLIKQHDSELKSLAILSENTLSELNNKVLLDTLFKNMGFIPEYFLVDNFDQWKNEFVRLNNDFDVIYLPTNGAIRKWDDDSAKEFVLENTKIITFTCDEFMIDYAVFGLTKIAAEQGEWVAEAILRIVNGDNIENIPISKNVKYKRLVNDELAKIVSYSPF